MKLSDFHVHTNFSDGQDSPEKVIERVKELSLASIAITDHFDRNDPRSRISEISESRLLEHFDLIRALSDRLSVKVLLGVETQPMPDGSLPFSDRIKNQCDVIITSCHYLNYNGHIQPGFFLNDDYWSCFRETLIRIAAAEGDILGHSEEYLPISPFLKGQETTFLERREICRQIADRYLDNAFIDRLGDALLSSGKACELHCATSTPRDWVIEKLAQKGVHFTSGSDAHEAQFVGAVLFAYTKAKEKNLVLNKLEVLRKNGT